MRLKTFLGKSRVELTPEERLEERTAMRGRRADSAEDNPGHEEGTRFQVFEAHCPSCGGSLHGIHRVHPGGAVDPRAIAYYDDANEAEKEADDRNVKAAYKSFGPLIKGRKVQRPGSRGGTFHVDAQGNVVYDGKGDHGVGPDMLREMTKEPNTHWHLRDVPAEKIPWGGEAGYNAYKNASYEGMREPANTHPKENYFDNLETWYLENPRKAPIMLGPERPDGTHKVHEGFHRNHIAHHHGMTHIPALVKERSTYKSFGLQKSGVDSDTKAHGVMVALYPDPKVARSLAIPGGEDPAEMHLTLGYFGKADDLSTAEQNALKNLTHQLAHKVAQLELVGRVSGLGYFQTPDSDQECLYASVDVPGLNSIYHWLLEKCREKGLPMSGEHGFSPHVTLTYQKRGTPRPKRATPLPEITFGPEHLVCKIGSETYSYPNLGDTECPDCGFEDCQCLELSRYEKSFKSFLVHRSP